MKIGFIGVGTIGQPLARNLIKAGYKLTVYDLDKQRAPELLAMGAAWANCAAEAAVGCDVLMTSLPGPTQVKAVLAEAGPALPDNAIWVDLTTSDLNLTREIAADLFRRGIRTLEAPITGGVANALIGKITIFVGGPRDAFDAVEPILKSTAADVFHLGDVGSGAVVKLITNFVAFIHGIALGEGLIFGRKYGIDQTILMEAIKSSYADSFLARTDGEKILSGDYGTDFSLSLAYKDMVLARDLAREMGLKLELTEATGRILGETMARFGGDVGSLATVRYLEETTGVAIARPKA